MIGPAPTAVAVEQAARRVFAAPAYDWTEPSAAESWLFRQMGRLGDWLQSLNAIHPWLFRAVLYVIVAGLILATLRGAWTAWRLMRSSRATSGSSAERTVPLRFAREAEDLQGAADAAARDGRYADAMQLLWAAFDRSLRASGRIATGRALTPRELVGELRAAPTTAGALGPLIRCMYGVCYGAELCSGEDWQAWARTLRSHWSVTEAAARAA